MASYTNWNQALASYFISGVPRGTHIYLSVDDDVLERIGNNFDGTPIKDSWSHDFRVAVREKVIVGGRVNLGNLQGQTPDGLPQGIAFLGATVLAAYQMAEEGKIDQNNYFLRLQEILGFQGLKSGRPLGMERGFEEPLWLEWKSWLMEQGFLPSAQRGEGSTKYISYPISQTLLRRSDKERLCQLFQEKQWRTPWDAQSLITRIRQEAPQLTQHLKDLLTGARSAQRYEAIAESLHELYEQWRENRLTEGSRASSSSIRNLFAGLYRTEDPFLGDIEYYLYPKQPRGLRLEQVEVRVDNNPLTLREEQPGWYLPLKAVGEVELESGATYPIDSPDYLNSLILPQRDFWVLTPDPENSDSGVYASWGTPALGTSFILLCKQQLLKDLQRLRDERLLEWSGEPQAVDGSVWVELARCMVTSQAWDGVFIDRQDLKDALQPTVRLSISLSGGLRVPSQQGWLADYPPQVTVFSFCPRVDLEVSNLLNEQVVETRSQKTNQPIPLDLPGTGIYLVRAIYAREVAERVLRIVDWNGLEMAVPERQERILIGNGYSLCGSRIQQIPELS